MRTATLLLIVCPLFAQTQPPLPEGASLEIVVLEATGEVDVRPSAKDKWVAATAGMKLAPGAKICTGVESSATIAFGTNSVALVTPATVLEIRQFAFEGDKLLAQVFLDPGQTRVSVKQLAQFQTDFQVSTPRLTCSVRGTVTLVDAPGDEQPHTVEVIEHKVEVEQASGQERTVSEGGMTNSDNESSEEIATRENLADTTPEGSTEQETQDENLLSNTNQSLELDTGSLTTNTDSSPSGGDNELAPPPEPPETTPRTLDLVKMIINGQDATVHAADDIPGENDGDTGLEGLDRQELLDLAMTEGYASFIQALLQGIHDDFHAGAAQLEQQDPQLWAERHALFHDPLPEAAFDALSIYLQDAGQQAAVGTVDPATAVLILASEFHADYHIIHATDSSAVFDPMHAQFHAEFDPILQEVVNTALEDALAMWGHLVHRTWHDATGCSDFLDQQNICFGPHQHFEMRLIETGNNLRGATETLAILTNEEELMVHTYLNHADVRSHSRDANDVTKFQLRHDHMDFEHNALGVTGLGAGVRRFDVADTHAEFHEDQQGLEQSNPSLFAARHTDFHVSDTVFGLDGYNNYWTEVAEDARSQTVDRFALSHALIAGLDVDFLKANYALPPGNSPGQYDFERAQFQQNVIDPLHATADADQFAQFIHDYNNFLHGRWHQTTGIPQNVQSGQTGFEAHEHFHQSLDDFHAQTHAATGVPD